MSNLVILAGLPGSGKSTYAELILRDYKIVSSDEIRKRLAGSLKRAHEEAVSPWDVFYGEIDMMLSYHRDVVADATFLTVDHRERVREVAKVRHANTHFVLFKNIWEATMRNAARPDETRVPVEVMEGFVDLYNDTLVRIVQEGYTSLTMIESFR